MDHEPSRWPGTDGLTINRRAVLGAIIAAGVVAPLIGTGTAHADVGTDEPPAGDGEGEEYEIPDGIGAIPWW